MIRYSLANLVCESCLPIEMWSCWQLGYGTVSYFEYIFFYWIYYYFREIRHMSQSETSTYATVIFLAWVVMTPLGGWLSDRLIRIFGKENWKADGSS